MYLELLSFSSNLNSQEPFIFQGEADPEDRRDWASLERVPAFFLTSHTHKYSCPVLYLRSNDCSFYYISTFAILQGLTNLKCTKVVEKLDMEDTAEISDFMEILL